MSESTAPAGWYADPSGQGGLRYWDGTTWTEHAAPAPAPAPVPAPAPAFPPYQPAPGTDGFAIASFVLGLIAIVPLGIVFGILALVRIAKSRRGGKGLAIAGLILSGLWILGTGGLIAIGVATGAFDAFAPGQIPQTRLKVGDCIEAPAEVGQIPRSFDSRDCSALHNGEVYSVAALPAGGYPGEDLAQRQVAVECRRDLELFLGGSIDQSPLHILYIYPTQQSWSLGSRRFVCIAVDREHDVRGTLRGALQDPGSSDGGPLT